MASPFSAAARSLGPEINSGRFSPCGTCAVPAFFAARDRAGDVAVGNQGRRRGCGRLRDRNRGRRVGRRGPVQRLLADRRRRSHGGRGSIRRGCGRRGGAIGRRQRIGGRLGRMFHGRHRRWRAGVEQGHRHLEGAEHDHDHAGADQQRADFRGDVRGRLVALGLVGGLGAASLALLLLGRGGLGRTARGGDEAR